MTDKVMNQHSAYRYWITGNSTIKYHAIGSITVPVRRRRPFRLHSCPVLILLPVGLRSREFGTSR